MGWTVDEVDVVGALTNTYKSPVWFLEHGGCHRIVGTFKPIARALRTPRGYGNGLGGKSSAGP